MSSRTAAKLRTPSRFASLLGILALCAAPCAIADTTSLTIAGTTKSTSNVPVTMQFPIVRLGDLGYETILNYHTVDGSALAGTDYTSANGSIVIPAGASGAMIPVTLSANTGAGATNYFQMIVDSAVGVGPTPSFAAPQAFATGANAMSVAVVDLNGDGRPDLIVGNVNGSSISVLLNTTVPGATTPSFDAQQAFATGTNPLSVHAVDINGDGKPDVIVANLVDDTVSVLLNTTAPGAVTPNFATQQTFATGSSPISIVATDINGDGKPDLIVANAGGNTVSVLLNTTVPGGTTLSFATQQTFSAGANPFFVTAADINGDGKPDLMVVSGGVVSVLLNTTAPGSAVSSFSAEQTFAAGSSPWSATAADVNGDGKLDLVVANYNDNTVSVLRNTTAPGANTANFAPQQIFSTGNGPRSVTAADVNGDGKPDLVVTNSIGSGSVSILQNTNAPGATSLSFAAPVTFASGQIPNAVAVADFNGDGKPDLVAANQGTNTVSVLLNATAAGGTSAPSFATQQQFTDANVTALTAADMNCDGKLDLIMANSGNNTVSVLPNTTPPGAIYPSFAAMQNFGAGRGTDSVAAADVNGDGKRDIIVANSSDGTVSLLLNTTAAGASIPSFATQQTFSAGIEPNNIAAADLNGDGRPDIVVTDNPQNDVVVLLNTTVPGSANLSFAPQQAFFLGANRPNSVTLADVNGDGRLDLISATDGNNISVLLNTTAPGVTTPGFAAAQSFAAGGGNPNFVTASDINGDGKPDLIVTNGGNSVSVLLNTTVPGAMTLSFAAAQSFSTPNGPSSVAAVDIDGDGRPDLIVSNSAFAIPSNTVSVLLNTTAPGASAPNFATQQAFATGEYPHSVIATDINGDGKLDIVVANNGTISVLPNTQYQTEVFGSPATGTLVHDYIFADGFGP